MSHISQPLLEWYRQNARSLPWRGHPDPYAVWVSEIMLQQTRVEAVIPYFERWMSQFPTLPDLAQANLHNVLAAWEGLGYYSRARNLHRAAQMVQQQHAGKLPRTPTELQKLPGIGRYTAAAIASIAFGVDVAALDGNVKRILARLHNLTQPVSAPAAEAALWQWAEEHLPNGKAAEYNQALMDLGSAICLPKNPRCPVCPLQIHCQAYNLGIQHARPVPKTKKQTPHRNKGAAILLQEGKTLLIQRPAGGLLGGLWEFPAAEVDQPDSAPALVAAIEAAYGLKILPLNALPPLQHAYTHFTLQETPWLCRLTAPLPGPALQWVELSALPQYPMGKIDRQIAKNLLQL